MDNETIQSTEQQPVKRKRGRPLGWRKVKEPVTEVTEEVAI
jgi:hypothetical protein